MASDQLIAVATDALRGLLQAALPPDAVVTLGPPAADAVVQAGLSLHLFRIGTVPALRQSAPVLSANGTRLRPQVGLQLDYLVSGLGGEPLQELGLLGTALRALNDAPVRESHSLGGLLSQPERLASLSPGSVSVQWRVLDLPVEQVCQVWVGSGMRQRGGVFCRGEVVWQVGQG